MVIISTKNTMKSCKAFSETKWRGCRILIMIWRSHFVFETFVDAISVCTGCIMASDDYHVLSVHQLRPCKTFKMGVHLLYAVQKLGQEKSNDDSDWIWSNCADSMIMMFLLWCWVWISTCVQCDMRVVWRHVFEYCCNCYILSLMLSLWMNDFISVHSYCKVHCTDCCLLLSLSTCSSLLGLFRSMCIYRFSSPSVSDCDGIPQMQKINP